MSTGKSASFDAVPMLRPDEDESLAKRFATLDRGEGTHLEDVRADLDAIVCH